MKNFTLSDYQQQLERAKTDFDLVTAEQTYDNSVGPRSNVEYQQALRLERATQNLRVAQHELDSFIRREEEETEKN